MVNETAVTEAADVDLDALFGALADPVRRGIVARLAAGEATAGELAEPYAISLPAISRHLKVLEHAGLLRRRIDGRLHRCSLDGGRLKTATDWVEHYRVFWETQFGRLEEFLAEQESDRNSGTRRRGRATGSRPLRAEDAGRRGS